MPFSLFGSFKVNLIDAASTSAIKMESAATETKSMKFEQTKISSFIAIYYLK